MLWVLLYYALEIVKWLIIVRALLSWFAPPSSDNRLVDGIRRITDPILRPFSEMLPSFGGVDISPLLAFLAIYLIQAVIIRAA